jgi:hypothetical protein
LAFFWDCQEIAVRILYRELIKAAKECGLETNRSGSASSIQNCVSSRATPIKSPSWRASKLCGPQTRLVMNGYSRQPGSFGDFDLIIGAARLAFIKNGGICRPAD